MSTNCKFGELPAFSGDVMVQTIQARNATLRELIDNFGIYLVLDNQFFREWQDLGQLAG